MENNKVKELTDEALAQVAGGALTQQAYMLIDMAMLEAKKQNMTREECISVFKTEWDNRNAGLVVATTDFSQADYDALLAYFNANW